MGSLKYNEEHYRDKTACMAIHNIEADDMKRLKKALKAARSALRQYGFDTVHRITLIDQRTGKIYR